MDNQNNQELPVQPQVPGIQEPEQPKKPSHSLLLIAITIIIITFALGVSAFIFNYSNKKNPLTPSSTSLTPTKYQQPAEYKIIRGSLYRILSNGREELLIDIASLKYSSQYNLDSSPNEIIDFSFSPDKSKIVLFVRGEADENLLFYVNMENKKTTFISKGFYGLWSPNSRYIAYTRRVTDVGPNKISVFDTKIDSDTEIIEPKITGFTNYSDPLWEDDSLAIRVKYITEDAIPPYGDGNIIASGEASIKFK